MLIDNRSLRDFFANVISPLAFYGYGDVRSLMDLKMYEIRAARKCLDDRDLMETWYNMHGRGL